MIKKGYDAKKLSKTISEVSEFSRDDLLRDKDPKKNSTVIFVSDWHPLMKQLPNILKKHHHLLKNDEKLNKVFDTVPLVAFRKRKSIRNYVVRNSMAESRSVSPPCSGSLSRSGRSPRWTGETMPCNSARCKLCKNILKKLPSSLNKLDTHEDCKSRNVIYAALCKKHNLIYVGQTGETLSDRFSKHRYDIRKRPENSELAQHFHFNHDLDKDLGVTILERVNIIDEDAREYFEERWICKLHTLQPHGLNQEVKGYAKEMYACYQQFSK